MKKVRHRMARIHLQHRVCLSKARRELIWNEYGIQYKAFQLRTKPAKWKPFQIKALAKACQLGTNSYKPSTPNS